MSQLISTEWSRVERIIFRLVFCYLLCYFVFLDGFVAGSFPILNFIHAPLQDISNSFVGLVNGIFIRRDFQPDIYKGFGDTSWSCIAILSYCLLSIIATAIWTIFDKRTNYLRLLTVLHTYARYYLAFILLLYGIGKLFGVQFFDPSPDYLMQPLGNIDSHTLFWIFMGNSKSYNFFGGLMEVIPASLLLFRRTTPLGALLAIAVLINVLMLDIGYDTLVKVSAFHLILIGLFILSPYIKRLLNFFILNRPAALGIFARATDRKFRLIQAALKTLVIACLLYTTLNVAIETSADYSRPYFGGIDGVYEIQDFYLNRQLIPPAVSSGLRWKRIGINRFGQITLQFMNDSVAYYNLSADSTKHSLTISSWNDSTFNSRFNYTKTSSQEYVFDGMYQTDSIRFSSRKIDLHTYPLLKDKGNVKWLWW